MNGCRRFAQRGHLMTMAGSGHGPSDQAQASRLGHCCRPGAAAELVADVCNMAVDGVLAEDQMLGDLPIAQPAGDEGEHLALPAREQGGGWLDRWPFGGLGDESWPQR